MKGDVHYILVRIIEKDNSVSGKSDLSRVREAIHEVAREKNLRVADGPVRCDRDKARWELVNEIFFGLMPSTWRDKEKERRVSGTEN